MVSLIHEVLGTGQGSGIGGVERIVRGGVEIRERYRLLCQERRHERYEQEQSRPNENVHRASSCDLSTRG